jgi:hypothetical protein
VNRDAPAPLLPLPRAADSSLVADPAPHPFTNACASARGHSGDKSSLLPSVKPDHRARGRNVVSRTPPHLRCVMPAFKPGWEAPLAGVVAVPAARATPTPSLFLVSHICLPESRVATAVLTATAFSMSVCARMLLSAHPRARAPAHAHAFAWEGKTQPFPFCSSERTELARVSPP